MCRWLAYSGPEIYMDTLLLRPKHSLLMQSRFARQNYVTGLPDFPDGAFPTNGDGFGFGWYGEQRDPGLYRELRPAWSDENFASLARNIKSRLFMAHLRAAYDGIVQRTNSHPFAHDRFLFQHNGEVMDFACMRRELMLELDPRYFNCVHGTTDSEVCFYLALTLGMAEDVKTGLERMTGRIEQARLAHGISGPFRLTCAVADGQALYAVRYSSDHQSKTLYINDGPDALRRMVSQQEELPETGHLVLSEPLDDCDRDWLLLEESSFVEIRGDKVEVTQFTPQTDQ